MEKSTGLAVERLVEIFNSDTPNLNQLKTDANHIAVRLIMDGKCMSEPALKSLEDVSRKWGEVAPQYQSLVVQESMDIIGAYIAKFRSASAKEGRRV